MTTPRQFDTALDVANFAAAKVASRYRGIVERADVAQDLAIWILTHPVKVDEWLEADIENGDRAGERALATTLRRKADQYARQQKANQAGYSTDDEHFYDVGQVEVMLGPVIDGTYTKPQLEIQGKVRETKALNEGGGWIAACADLSNALRTISVDAHQLLAWRYADGRTLSDIAREMDVSETTVRKRIDRTLGVLLDALGGASPWPTADRTYRRSHLSNAQAQALLEEER